MYTKPISVRISVPLFPLLRFCLADLPIGESKVLKSPTISVWNLMCALSFCNVSVTNVGVLVFGA